VDQVEVVDAPPAPAGSGRAIWKQPLIEAINNPGQWHRVQRPYADFAPNTRRMAKKLTGTMNGWSFRVHFDSERHEHWVYFKWEPEA
jgi:hypothetical protein